MDEDNDQYLYHMFGDFYSRLEQTLTLQHFVEKLYDTLVEFSINHKL